MDEASIQNLRADLTEDYHTLVKSHTAAIEQLLEDFNDDQMMFRLEAEAFERERLAARQPSPSTPTEQNDEPPIEDTTDAGQEGHAPAEGPSEQGNTPPTVPEPVITKVSSLEATPPLTARRHNTPGPNNSTTLTDTTTGPPCTYPGPRDHPRHPRRGIGRESRLRAIFCNFFGNYFCKSRVRRTMSCPTGVPGVVHWTKV